MLSFFLTSDVHFDYYRTLSTVLPDGSTSRLHEIAEAVHNGLKRADSPLSIFAGDILLKSKSIDYTLGNFVKNFFKKIKGEIIVIPGNHDVREVFGETKSILNVLLPENVLYLDQPTMRTMDGGVVLHFVPFIGKIEVLKETIESIKPVYDKINILISHFSVEKAKIRDDFSVSVGRKWEAIRLTLLQKFDYCLLGDIHLSQEIDGFVFYPGDPLQLNFGEEGQEKATWKITVGNGEIKKEKLVTKAKEFKTIEVFTEADLEKVREEERKGNFVRVYSHIKAANKINLDRVLYREVPKEVTIDTTTDYKHLIRDYVRQKDEEILPMLDRFWK